MIVPLVWAGVALFGLVLAYRVALAFAQRPVELARRVQCAETAIGGNDARLAGLEKAAETTRKLDEAFELLEARVLTVEQRTDPHLARRR